MVSSLSLASILTVFTFLLSDFGHASFVTPTTTFVRRQSVVPRQLSVSDSLDVFDGSSSNLLTSMNNLWLATIDSDIDSIPDNEFATVFAGGIVVMLGGVLSALIVGFILEKGDLYANVVADSYAQGAEDEEFWKGLSEEEKIKTRELLQKIKERKEGGEEEVKEEGSQINLVAEEAGVDNEENQPAASKTEKSQASTSKPVDMFSDYGDSS